MSIPIPANPALHRLCPECGTAQDEVSFARAVHPRWTRPLATLLPILVVLALALWDTASLHYSNSGSFYPAFLSTPVSIPDLMRLARGEPVDRLLEGTLSRAVLDAARPHEAFVPGDAKLYFGVAPPAKEVSETWAVGFPSNWIVIRKQSCFRDAVKRTGFRPCKTSSSLPVMGQYEVATLLPEAPPRPLLAWSAGTIAIQPPPERTKGVFTSISIPPSGTAAACVAAFLVCRVGFWVWRRVRGRPTRLLGRATIVVAVLALVCAAIAGATVKRWNGDKLVIGAKTKVVATRPCTLLAYEDFGECSASRRTLALRAQEAGADQWLAARILEAIPEGSNPDHQVAVWTLGEAWIPPSFAKPNDLEILWHAGLAGVHTSPYSRYPTFVGTGPLSPPPQRWGADWKYSVPRIWWWRSATESRDGYQVGMYISPGILILLIAAILLARALLIRGILLYYGFRRARRRKAGQCFACGYSLA